MTTCPDVDSMLTIGMTLRWNEEMLSHVGKCEACRERFLELARVHHFLMEETAPGTGFTEAVMTELQETRQAGGSFWRGLELIGSPLLAGFTGFFVAALATRTSGIGFGAPMVIVALLAAAGTFGWNAMRSPRPEPQPSS